MIEVLKQALEALEDLPALDWIPEKDKQAQAAITSLRQAIEQAEKQEPVAFMDKGKFEHLKKNNAVLTTLTSWGAFDDDVALYTSPYVAEPRQPQKPLTVEEIDKAWRSCDYTVPWEQHRIDIARAIEAAHNIKE